MLLSHFSCEPAWFLKLGTSSFCILIIVLCFMFSSRTNVKSVLLNTTIIFLKELCKVLLLTYMINFQNCLFVCLLWRNVLYYIKCNICYRFSSCIIVFIINEFLHLMYNKDLRDLVDFPNILRLCLFASHGHCDICCLFYVSALNCLPPSQLPKACLLRGVNT